MSTYLLTFRAPNDYAPSGDTFDAWATWQLKLGAQLKDRGNPAFAAATLGNCAAASTLGGYSLIRASSLVEAVALAEDCPILVDGGGVEVGELTNHDDKFDEWLESRVMATTFMVEQSVQIAATPESVFPYFTDPARYVQWMGTEAKLEPVPGGVYRVLMGDGFRAAGTFLQVSPPHTLAFTWGFADDDAAKHVKHEQTEASSGSAIPAGGTLVTVALKAEDGGTRLTLRHQDLPNLELRDGHQVAWRTYLPRLVIRAEGGNPGADPHA
jgi:uncharacterized protein YndB with AHSA1/START domain